MTNAEETLTESGIPIRSQSARFLFGSAKPGRGFLLLYPDRVTAVNSPADTWGYAIGPVIFLVLSLPLSHRIGYWGVAAGSAIGGWIGNDINKRRAVAKAAEGGDGVTVIPFDLITGVRTGKPRGMSGRWGIRILVVTTADGTEYEFRGTMEKWQAYLTDALTARGCGVHPAADGIMVTPPSTWAEG
jgi:hypothetical protein